MPRKKKAHKTFHINVPEEDWEIMEWLSKQYNQSSSVRELIRAAAREGGMVDLFIGQAAERTPGVRGRAKQPKQGSELARHAAIFAEAPDALEYTDEGSLEDIDSVEDVAVKQDKKEDVPKRTRSTSTTKRTKASKSRTTKASTSAVNKTETKVKPSSGIKLSLDVLEEQRPANKQQETKNKKTTKPKTTRITKSSISDLKDLMDI